MKNSFLLAVIANFANPSKSTSSSVDLSDLSVDYAQTMAEATVIQMESKLRKRSSPNNDYLEKGRDYRYLGEDKHDIDEDEFYLGENKNEIAPISSRIVGGTAAKHGRYNYVAYIRKIGFQCGGMLIAPNLILTAAHCGSGFHTAYLGMYKYDLYIRNGSERIGIVKQIVIKGYDRGTMNQDFMILVLAKESNFQPVCLAGKYFKRSLKNGDMLHALGNGLTNFKDKSSYSNTLQVASLKYIRNRRCQNRLNPLRNRKSYEISRNMMCTDSSDEGRDACLGDSGGPLIQKNKKGKDVAVGVVSWGHGCAAYPGVYGAIGTVHEWIKTEAKKKENGSWNIKKYCA